LFAALFIVGAVIPGKAEMYKYEQNNGKSQRAQTAAGCAPSSSFEWLDINNVRTRINAGGDMWWDLPSGTGSKYYIPANGSATSLYAGSLWIAGLDINNQLKCAALRFRQVGNDYYTGPLSVDGRASIDDATCARWDKIFKITRAQVDEFLASCEENGGVPDPAAIPSIIKNWPAHPGPDDPVSISHYLAPFYDKDGNGEYDPEAGDYPYYDIDNELCHTKIPTMDEEIEGTMHGSILADQVLKGDQTLWWIFNDKGASHTESGGEAIGIEVRAQAFAFATNDEINNMTFYSYEIINRSTYTLTGTYFSPWTDVDLGYAKDDYVGCDVSRGLGYGYNGSNTDGSGEPEAYGSQPPAVGVDFFQGPYMDPDEIDNPKYTYEVEVTYTLDPVTNDTIFNYDTIASHPICDESINGVNFGNGIIDDERFGMRRFVYHNNTSSSNPNSDPEKATDYYNYLRGIWKNNKKMSYGGDALNNGDVVGPDCDFMFPGDSDPLNWGTGGVAPNGGYNTNGKYWTEEQCQNPPNDRRFMQSAGPFELKPGAVNYITFGVPWARATSGGAMASVELLRVVDDKCQALFDNCFKVIDGPNAPDLTIRELDQQLIIYLSNTPLSNNYKEGYVEKDPEIPVSKIETSTHHEEVIAYVGCVDTVFYMPHNFDPNGPVDTIQCNIGGVDTTLYIPQGFDGTDFDTIICQVGCELDTLWNPIETPDEPVETFYDRYYRFEGYKVYQLANAEVGADELDDTNKARLVFQCDVRNNVSRIMNYEYDESLQAAVPKLKADGGNAGITHSFIVTEDKFSTGDNPALVNHKTYYFMAVAYAYNNYETYTPDDPNALSGQKKPYLEGRKNIVCYSAVPHKIVDGTILNCTYGDQPAIKRIVGVGNGGNELELSDESIATILSKPIADDSINVLGSPNYPIDYHPTYKAGYGPIDVKVVDPLNVVSTTYELWFDTLFPSYTHNITGNPDVRGDSAMRMVSHWYLKDVQTGEIFESDTTTVYGDERLFVDRGISVNVTQTYDIGRIKVGEIYVDPDWQEYTTVVAPDNGVITSSIEFEDPTNKWLDGIRDVDVPGTVLDWIRSGTYSDINEAANNDYAMSSDAYGKNKSKPWDPDQNFEKIANGTWAPFLLTTYHKQGLNNSNPGPIPDANSRDGKYFKYTSSVDIVLTADTNLWTRCPVLEMCMDKNLAEGKAERFDLRKHASVDKRGRSRSGDYTEREGSLNESDPDYIAAQGMGWFPGYVIDVESGARLNVAFGEDSYLEDFGGRDMLFNPAKLLKSTIDQEYGEMSQMMDPSVIRGYGIDNEPVLGGKHFVYIWRMDSITGITANYKDIKNYAYDGGRLLYNTLDMIQNAGNHAKVYRIEFYKLAMWVGMPMGVEGTEWLPEGNACRIRIRVAKPYERGYVSNNDLKVTPDDLMVNNLYPKYEFTIEGMNPTMNDPEKSESDLDLVTVVPNPYYAYSNYEGNALTNRVKIANLPRKCVVSIFTINGTKVRQFRKDNDDPNIDWDLTNYANTPIASGFYLIHVKDLTSGGERTIKFFGAMRKIDLNTF
jgi:hypothetical protein